MSEFTTGRRWSFCQHYPNEQVLVGEHQANAEWLKRSEPDSIASLIFCKHGAVDGVDCIVCEGNPQFSDNTAKIRHWHTPIWKNTLDES